MNRLFKDIDNIDFTKENLVSDILDITKELEELTNGHIKAINIDAAMCLPVEQLEEYKKVVAELLKMQKEGK